ncbi:hypothetical protein ACF3NF_01555 [Anaerococcus martiniensis]|uniref:hypothetical protein n=1 Tax=Anaerococcus sp. WGS1579 TaxID=3366809 RepID=UPI00372D2202
MKTCDLKGLAVKSAGPFCMFGRFLGVFDQSANFASIPAGIVVGLLFDFNILFKRINHRSRLYEMSKKIR